MFIIFFSHTFVVHSLTVARAHRPNWTVLTVLTAAKAAVTAAVPAKVGTSAGGLRGLLGLG